MKGPKTKKYNLINWMKQRKGFDTSVSASQVLLLSLLSVVALNFDFDTGFSGREVIIPTILSLSYLDMSPKASDPSIILRMTSMAGFAWFDAVAPYHPTAIGIYTQHSHRLTENTNGNKNIAMLY